MIGLSLCILVGLIWIGMNIGDLAAAVQKLASREHPSLEK